MNVLTFDVETTHTHKTGGGTTALPYFGNRLVAIGYKWLISTVTYDCYYHSTEQATPDAFGKFQLALNHADILIGQNIKFDLQWIRDCGFTYEGFIYDTMVTEYVLSKARRWPLGLASLAQKYEVGSKRKDLVQPYLDEGLTFDKIPYHIVEEYGKEDVFVTERIALEQTKAFGTTLEMLCNDS